MKKNGKFMESGLTIENIERQKETLQKELENVEKSKQQLSAKAFALSGAIQQCDMFLEMIEASPASSIPSQDNSAVSTALS
jgi:hypothetical protein